MNRPASVELTVTTAALVRAIGLLAMHFPEKFHLESWRGLTAEIAHREIGLPARPITLARQHFDGLPPEVKEALDHGRMTQQLLLSPAPSLPIALPGALDLAATAFTPRRRDAIGEAQSKAPIDRAGSMPHNLLVPWNNPISYAFTQTSVVGHAPAASGVYALYNKATWVYVGETDNIRAQLIQYLNGDSVCITLYPSLSFSFELVPPLKRPWRLDEVIREFLPACNPRRPSD